jgi:hypothetical protein
LFSFNISIAWYGSFFEWGYETALGVICPRCLDKVFNAVGWLCFPGFAIRFLSLKVSKSSDPGFLAFLRGSEKKFVRFKNCLFWCKIRLPGVPLSMLG